MTGKTEVTGAELVGMLLGALSVFALEAWLFMLLVGALHSYISQVPAFGYVPTLLGIVLVSSLGRLVFGKRN